ncbi:uncharacterized protein [Dermacentor andersoni]|uniref:uncharacterized protein n=1 Tax=Dermacentor andersoni TaxID=34620 RepID=UPI003B3AA317
MSALIARDTPSPWGSTSTTLASGIRCSLKSDIECSNSELVYGILLRLPNNFLSPQPPVAALATHEYVQLLRDLFRHLKPYPTGGIPARTPSISTDVTNATHVFVRSGPVQPALHPQYLSPLPVLVRRKSTYIVGIHGKTDTITLGRLKAAYCEMTSTVASLKSSPDVSFPSAVTPVKRLLVF